MSDQVSILNQSRKPRYSNIPRHIPPTEGSSHESSGTGHSHSAPIPPSRPEFGRGSRSTRVMEPPAEENDRSPKPSAPKKLKSKSRSDEEQTPPPKVPLSKKKLHDFGPNELICVEIERRKKYSMDRYSPNLPNLYPPNYFIDPHAKGSEYRKMAGLDSEESFFSSGDFRVSAEEGLDGDAVDSMVEDIPMIPPTSLPPRNVERSTHQRRKAYSVMEEGKVVDASGENMPSLSRFHFSELGKCLKAFERRLNEQGGEGSGPSSRIAELEAHVVALEEEISQLKAEVQAGSGEKTRLRKMIKDLKVQHENALDAAQAERKAYGLSEFWRGYNKMSGDVEKLRKEAEEAANGGEYIP